MSLRRPQPDTDSMEEENFIEGRTALARSMRITKANFLQLASC